MPRIGLQFTAEIGDVNIQRAGIIPIVGSPDAAEKLIAGDSFPSLGHQHGQNTAGDRPELLDRPVDLEVARRCVEAHVSHTDHIGGMVYERGLDKVNEGLRSMGSRQAGVDLWRNGLICPAQRQERCIKSAL
jgi:hypothetical protein